LIKVLFTLYSRNKTLKSGTPQSWENYTYFARLTLSWVRMCTGFCIRCEL